MNTDKIQLLRRDNLAVAIFNYCGVGESGGHLDSSSASPSFYQLASRFVGSIWGSFSGYHYFTNRESLIIQTGSMISFIRERLRFDPNKIFVLGHSIGGALSVQSAVHFPRVHVFADRTFAHLSDVAQFHGLPWACRPESASLWYATMARKALWVTLDYVVGWELATLPHWQALLASRQTEGRHLVIAFHPQDK